MTTNSPTRLPRAALTVAVVLCGINLAGCKKGGGIDVATVTGTVSYQGKPVEGALVMFKPKSEKARVASGSTRADGSFQLITSGSTDNGAMPGEYDVLISKTIEVDAAGKPVTYSPENYNPAAAPQTRTTQKSVLPAKYNDPRSPLLSAAVAERSNNFVFDLTD